MDNREKRKSEIQITLSTRIRKKKVLCYYHLRQPMPVFL